MRTETRDEKSQRYHTRSDIQRHLYWNTLIAVELATSYQQFAPFLDQFILGREGPHICDMGL